MKRGQSKAKILKVLSEAPEGATAYTLAKLLNLSARHVNRLMIELFEEGLIGFYAAPHRGGEKRVWIVRSSD